MIQSKTETIHTIAIAILLLVIAFAIAISSIVKEVTTQEHTIIKFDSTYYRQTEDSINAQIQILTNRLKDEHE